MGEFVNWEMPISYESITEEHIAVREGSITGLRSS